MPATDNSVAMIFTAAATIVAAAFFLGALVCSIVALKKWQGRWKFAAGLPILALISLAAVIIIAVMRDPTAHNLWPFEFVIWGIASLIYMGLLVLARRIFRARD